VEQRFYSERIAEVLPSKNHGILLYDGFTTLKIPKDLVLNMPAQLLVHIRAKLIALSD